MPHRKSHHDDARTPNGESPSREADGAPNGTVSSAVDLEMRVQQLQLLVRAGQTLGSSLDFHETLQHAASLMVPDMADFCVVDLLDEDGRGVHLVGMAHTDSTKADRARQLRERYPVMVYASDASDGVGSVIRTGRSALVPIVTRERLESYARDEQHLKLLERVGLRSVIITPLVARGATIGSLMLVWSDTDRHYDASDLQFAEEFARRAALAVDNARLYQRTQELNATLERRISEKTHQVWQLASEVTSAEARERSRIARLLHDDLQQRLHVLQVHLSELRAQALDVRLEAFERTHAETVQGLKDVLDATRNLTGELSPVVLHTEDFAAALHWLGERFREQHNLAVDIDAPSGLRFSDETLRDLVFSLVKECLFNVVKHAGVDEARVVLRRTEQRVEVEIRDDGAGFDPTRLSASAHTTTGLGLRSAAQRVEFFNGAFRVDSGGDRPGTCITVSLPADTLVGDDRTGRGAAP